MNYLVLLKTIQIILCFALIVLVLIQSKGKGLASQVGNAFGAYRSRRGAEKIVFIATIVFTVLLIANSLLIVLGSK